MNKRAEWGLLAKDGAVPLTGVRIDARLRGGAVDVTVTQRYRNTEAVPVEAVYAFPLDEGAAVCGFAVLVGGTLVRGQVEERESAFDAYDDAMHRGDGAFLLDQERPNVFTAQVGNLRPGEEVALQIRYVATAMRDGDALRLMIPTTVSPRYVPDAPKEIGQPDGERVNPPNWPEVPYGLALAVDVDEPALASVDSPSHPIRTTLRTDGARVELSHDAVALDRDFVLRVVSREPAQPVARVAREADGRRVVMLTFLPELPSDDAGGREVLFLLDCSGSMGGESIAQARRALSLCLRALREGDSFNVVCFGSRFESLWPEPRAFDQASLDAASAFLSKVEANLGGTEILAPLAALLEAPRDPGRERRVLVLTDGEVSNEDAVLALTRKHAGATRVFAFGIGAGASEYLVRGLARASRGAADMIFPGERIEPKVLRMIGRVRAPVLDDVAVDFAGMKVEQAPMRTPPAFSGDPLTVFARIERGSAARVALVAGGRRWEVPLDLERAEADGPIPVLWARERIRELEESSFGEKGSKKAETERLLIELGKRYGLTSSATSYVAVEERSDEARTREPAALRRIPIALTDGWGGGESAQMVHAPIPMMAMASFGRSPIARALSVSAPAAAAYELEPSVARARAPLGFRAGGSDGISPPAAPAHHAPREESASADDRLYELLLTQRADGSFARSSALEAWLGRARLAAFERACKAHGEALVSTSVVLALLAREASDRESEWREATRKADAWCKRQATSFDASALV